MKELFVYFNSLHVLQLAISVRRSFRFTVPELDFYDVENDVKGG